MLEKNGIVAADVSAAGWKAQGDLAGGGRAGSDRPGDGDVASLAEHGEQVVVGQLERGQWQDGGVVGGRKMNLDDQGFSGSFMRSKETRSRAGRDQYRVPRRSVQTTTVCTNDLHRGRAAAFAEVCDARTVAWMMPCTKGRSSMHEELLRKSWN